MKFQHTRKFLALMLVFLLAAQLTSIASAATVTWTDSDGNTLAATVIKKAGYTQRRVKIESTKTYHTYGNVETIRPGTWSVTATGDIGFSGSSIYFQKLREAASKEGLKNSHTGYVTRTSNFNIPASSPSGNYWLGTHFNGNQGTYRVEKIGSSSGSDLPSGSFSFAPYACVGDTFLCTD